MEYAAWHAKRNPATGELALRTIFPEDQGPRLAGMAWLISHADAGVRHAPTSEVADWDDWPEPSSPDE